MNARRLSLLSLCVALCACSGSFSPIGASAEDYGQYRALRTSEGFEQRLRAGWVYLRDFPRGHWHAEVETWFEQAQATYLERFWDDRARLAKYLQLVPDSPRSSLVASRLAALDAARKAAVERDRAELAAVRESERRFAAARSQREIFIATYKDWLLRVATIRSWGRPTSALDAGLRHELYEAAPVAVCSEDHCVKSLILPFAVAEAGQLVDRRAQIEIDVQLRNGVADRASIRGVRLFEYLAEALRKQAIRRDDLPGKADAMAAAIRFSALALEAALPQSSCEVEATSPVVLVRACQGVKLEMRQDQGEGADSIEIAASLPPQG